MQVPWALYAVHAGSQKDDDAGGHQLGGHPALKNAQIHLDQYTVNKLQTSGNFYSPQKKEKKQQVKF